jgi:archaemetzincin
MIPPEGLGGADPQPPQNKAAQVEVIPLGPVNQVACAVAAANLQAIMELNCRVEPGIPLDAEAYLAVRRQYNAEKLLMTLGQGLPPRCLRLGITASDLCLPILSYVYGQAMVGGRSALVSLHRLGGEAKGAPVSREVLYERLAKVACHETAHALGLAHCREPGCLMRFSAGLTNLDALDLHFCRTCRLEMVRLRRELYGGDLGDQGAT